MLAYNIVTAICFALLTAEVAYVIVKLCIKDRASRIAFLRSFKKGKCAFVYIPAIPLYFLGYLFVGNTTVIDSFFKAVGAIINLVVLKYEYSGIQELMAANIFYKITIYYLFVLVTINAVLFTLSLTSQRIWQFIQSVKAKCTRRDKLIIFGLNSNNINIYNSDKTHNKTLVDYISEEDCTALYSKKISFVSTHQYSKYISRLFKEISRKDKKFTVIINTSHDESNLLLCRDFVKELSECEEAERNKLFCKLRVFVFGDPRFEAVYGEIVTSAYGCIQYINKYQKIAMRFIDRYPFTKFMNGTQIDYDSSLLHKDVNVNVCMIGFGKTNRQVFFTSVANNQFLTYVDDEIRLKPVNYYIFDKEKAESNKNLNHNYYRFRNECKGLDRNEYLPLPEYPAMEEYCRLDINDSGFYSKIKEVVTRGKKDANFVIIAFGTDLENIDMAQKLIEKRREWDAHFTIFVKSRVLHKEQVHLEKADCYFIANEKEEVFNLSEITGDSISRMAHMRNEIYDLEYTITHDKNAVVDKNLIEENRRAANEAWYCRKSELERESSLYCCLSLRSKLNLMGLDYCRINENGTPLTEEQYLERYAGDDLPDTTTYSMTADGKKIVHYTLDFAKSRRTTMAIHEHLRWNSFMLSKGLIPSSKDQILNETVTKDGKTKHTNGKNYLLRRHGNVTTFEGLVEFRKMITERDKSDELENDVIKYDYQLLDDAWWLLNENGYKIIEKND